MYFKSTYALRYNYFYITALRDRNVIELIQPLEEHSIKYTAAKSSRKERELRWMLNFAKTLEKKKKPKLFPSLRMKYDTDHNAIYYYVVFKHKTNRCVI